MKNHNRNITVKKEMRKKDRVESQTATTRKSKHSIEYKNNRKELSE